MDLHNSGSGLFVGMRELDLPVESSGAEERGIEDVHAIRGRDDFDLTTRRESVQLIEKLQHRTLHLAVTGLFRVESGRKEEEEEEKR